MEKNEFYRVLNSGQSLLSEKTIQEYTPSDAAPIFEPTPPPVNIGYEHFDSTLNHEQRREKYRFDLFEETPKSAERIKNSSQGKSSRAVEKDSKVNEKVLVQRLKALGLACLVAAGIAITSKTVEGFKENSVISPYTMSFHQNVVSPNTHRTYDNQHFFYDYEDISEYLTVEGADFSKRLFIATRSLGEYQVNRVLEYVPGVGSVQSYVEKNGFEDIEEWKESEIKKFLLEDEISKDSGKLNEKQAELDVMFADPYKPLNSKSDAVEYGGTK